MISTDIQMDRPDDSPVAVADFVLGAQLHKTPVSTLHVATRSGGDASRPKVVRVLSTRLIGEADACSMVQRETAVGALVASPYLVSHESVPFLPRQPYSAMEFVDGLSLEVLLNRDEGREDALKFLVRPVVDALFGLATLHGLADDRGPLGIVHQAPVPRHILVGLDGVGRLTDFTSVVSRDHGWSRRILDRLQTHELAPEQVLAPAQIDARCDVFIATSTLWRVLTGRALFSDADPEQSLQKLLRMPVPTLRAVGVDLGAAFERLIQRGLASARRDRMSSAAEFASELQSAAKLAGLYPSKEEVGAFVQSARFSRALVAAVPVRPEPVPSVQTSSVREFRRTLIGHAPLDITLQAHLREAAHLTPVGDDEEEVTALLPSLRAMEAMHNVPSSARPPHRPQANVQRDFARTREVSAPAPRPESPQSVRLDSREPAKSQAPIGSAMGRARAHMQAYRFQIAVAAGVLLGLVLATLAFHKPESTRRAAGSGPRPSAQAPTSARQAVQPVPTQGASKAVDLCDAADGSCHGLNADAGPVLPNEGQEVPAPTREVAPTPAANPNESTMPPGPSAPPALSEAATGAPPQAAPTARWGAWRKNSAAVTGAPPSVRAQPSVPATPVPVPDPSLPNNPY